MDSRPPLLIVILISSVTLLPAVSVTVNVRVSLLFQIQNHHNHTT